MTIISPLQIKKEMRHRKVIWLASVDLGLEPRPTGSNVHTIIQQSAPCHHLGICNLSKWFSHYKNS